MALATSIIPAATARAMPLDELSPKQFLTEYRAALDHLASIFSAVRQVDTEHSRTITTHLMKPDKTNTAKVSLRGRYGSDGERERYWTLETNEDFTEVKSEFIGIKNGDATIMIRRDSESSPYYLGSDEVSKPRGDALAKGKGNYVFAAWTCLELGPLPEIVNSDRFTISKVSPKSEDGTPLVQVYFRYRDADPKKPVKSGWLLFDS